MGIYSKHSINVVVFTDSIIVVNTIEEKIPKNYFFASKFFKYYLKKRF